MELLFGETDVAFELPVALGGEVRDWRSSSEFDSGRPFDEEGFVAQFADTGTSKLFATPSFGELMESVAALLASGADEEEEELPTCFLVPPGGSQMSSSLGRCFDWLDCVPLALWFVPALSLTLLDMIGFNSFTFLDGSGLWSTAVTITVGTTSLTLMASPVFD